jgi:hypothetical protein
VSVEKAVSARRKTAGTLVAWRLTKHPTAGDTVTLTFADGREIEVCSFCFGNCGQCGTSLAMGIPPSMNAMVYNLLHPA